MAWRPLLRRIPALAPLKLGRGVLPTVCCGNACPVRWASVQGGNPDGDSDVAALTELTRTAVHGGADAIFVGAGAKFAPPPRVEALRDKLRRQGLAVERGEQDRAEAMLEVKALLCDEHPLVRLAALHTIARIALLGDRDAWEAVAELIDDSDELVRVGALRAVGRIAQPSDADAIARLARAQRDAPDENARLAARDAEARVRGFFGVPGSVGSPPLLDSKSP